MSRIAQIKIIRSEMPPAQADQLIAQLLAALGQGPNMPDRVGLMILFQTSAPVANFIGSSLGSNR
jgi:hypothetical protein